MSFLDQKLEEVEKIISDEKKRTPIYDEIDKSKGKYEWARIVCLIGAKTEGVEDKKKDVFKPIMEKYGMLRFYSNSGEFQYAIGRAVYGTKKNITIEEIKEELKKFDSSTYSWNWNLKQLIDYIYNNEATSDNSKKNLEDLMNIGSTYIVNANGGVVKMTATDTISILTKLVEEENKKQIILTGAPGTGKTWSVRKFVQTSIVNEKDCEFVQFHPSYDYSDFVEGIKPVNIPGSNDPTFVKLDGTFKAFCRQIVMNNIEQAKSKTKSEDNQVVLGILYTSAKEAQKNKEDENVVTQGEKETPIENNPESNDIDDFGIKTPRLSCLYLNIC